VRLVPIVAALALVAGCSKNQQPQQQPPGSGEQITGNERLGWSQQAADAVELGDFKYAIYVDGARSVLANASCSSTPTSAGFDCTAPLPRMPAGAHTLAMAAYVDNGGSVLESPRSSSLSVVVSAAATSRPGAAVAPLTAGAALATAAGGLPRSQDGARGLGG